MNKKKYLIIGLITAFVIITIILLILFLVVFKKLTISFDTNGAKNIENMIVRRWQSVTLPEITRKGYDFDGWYYGESKVKSPVKFNRNVELKAKWISNELSIIIVYLDYDYDGIVENIMLEKGSQLNLPPNVTREGYKFLDWIDKDGNIVKSGKVLNETGEITLKATWEKLNDKKTYKVTFDSKGGSAVKSLTVECGKTLKLPSSPTRSGYTFVTWEDKSGHPIYNDALLSCEDITLYAVWNKKEEKKTYKVTFDSKGGSAVKSLTVECNKALKLPSSPIKSGYEFVTWEDKNGHSIYNDALLSCEDITLYAVWNKKEESITYTCPNGYTLNGTICFVEGTIKYICPTNTYEYNGKCYTITYDARKDSQKSCGTKTVHYGMGRTGTESGVAINNPPWYCYYGEVTPNPGKNACTSQGRNWNSIMNKCYYDKDQNILNSCSHLSGYEYVQNPATIRPGATLNGGCYPTQEKQKTCDSGFSLSNGKCIKTIPATAN